MFIKRGLLSYLPELLDGTPPRFLDSWNARIALYARKECWDEVLNCFEQMQLRGLSPNSFTYAWILKACRITGSLEKGMEAQAEIARAGLFERNVILGNALVDMYAKFGLLKIAKEVFDRLPARDIYSWTALIAGFAKHGHAKEALRCFDHMQDDGVPPNAVTYVCCLKACGSMKGVGKGQTVHAKIEKEGLLETNLAVGNALIDMYIKCGLIVKAHEVFNKLPAQDVVSWTALIAGYAKYGSAKVALNCFEEMQLKGVSPNSVTYVCCLTACGRVGDMDRGRAIHLEVLCKGILQKELAVGNALVDMYANCGCLTRAFEVFEMLPIRDVICWNALMSGYAKHECGKEALNCFEQMQLEGVRPDFSTLVCGLKACSGIGFVEKGREIHAEISRNGFLERNLVVGSALVDMYAKCGLLQIAKEVFDCLSTRDVISWNALIAGYAQHEYGEEVLECFKQMQAEGISPDAVTYVCSLKACASTKAKDIGDRIHIEVVKQGLSNDAVIGSALVDMYAKCGLVVKAQEVFDKLSGRDLVSWTALISGYTNQECAREALECFEQMELEGVLPNVVTFVCSLKACCSVGAVDKGREIHAEIARKGLMQRDMVVGSAVVEMYAKGGLLSKAHELFHELPLRDVNTWNVLISAYGRYEHGNEAISCFEQMQVEGVCPDSGTFVQILSACCHADLLDKGHTFFETMSKDFGIIPGLEHHALMVALLGRSGHLDTVTWLLKRMPFDPNNVVWDTLLDACRKWGNTELGSKAFAEVINAVNSVEYKGRTETQDIGYANT